MGGIEKMIEVEGLPEGWKAIAYRRPYPQEYILKSEGAMKVRIRGEQPWLIIERIKPRRIVLEEISKEEYHRLFNDERCSDIYNMRGSYWREVKETDIPLNSDEPKLSLSVDECRNVRSLIKDFENLGWFVNPARSLLLQKITKFLKENS